MMTLKKIKTTIETTQVITETTDKIIDALANKGIYICNNTKAIGIDTKGNLTFYLSLMEDTKDRLSSEEEFLRELEELK